MNVKNISTLSVIQFKSDLQYRMKLIKSLLTQQEDVSSISAFVDSIKRYILV